MDARKPDRRQRGQPYHRTRAGRSAGPARAAEDAGGISLTPPSVERVVLVHGLWMRGHIEMWPLRRRLRRAGFEPRQFSYSSLRESVQSSADLLWKTISALDGRPYHLVAHSLGGIVAMEALHRHGSAGLQRVVTLGSPLTGSSTARSMADSATTRWTLGRSRDGLLSGAPVLPPGIEVGSIAGNRALGVGSLLSTPKGPGDGSVSVAETIAPGLADHLTLPLSHSGLQLSALSADYIIRFLHSGRFRPL